MFQCQNKRKITNKIALVIKSWLKRKKKRKFKSQKHIENIFIKKKEVCIADLQNSINGRHHFDVSCQDKVHCVCVRVCWVTQSCLWLFAILWNVAHQVLLSLEFSRQECCSGLPCPPPGDLLDPGVEPASPGLLHCRRILYHWGNGEA